jgi:hypothetical protein
MFVVLVIALVVLVVAFAAGWLLILWLAIWLIVKRPILSIVFAVYVALVVWLGPHDAQALFWYALIVLALWRLVHKRSFQQVVGQRVERSWRPPSEYEGRSAHDDDAGVGLPGQHEVGCSPQRPDAVAREREGAR